MNFAATGTAPGPPIQLVHHTFARGGGMERYALTLIDGLHAAGCPVEVHCRQADEALAREKRVALHRLPAGQFPRRLRQFRFFRRVARDLPAAAGWQIALTRVPVRDAIVCGGTHRGYLQRARKRAGPFDRLEIWMETAAYRAARLVISHSHLCTGELRELYRVPAEKIVTLHPPVDTSFAPPLDEAHRAALRRELGLPADRLVLLFPSTGHQRKGLHPICRALQPFADRVVVAVAGKPPRGLGGPLVQDLGYLQNMAAAYGAADFTLLGSYYEPFGLVGIESVLCGTRLIFERDIGCLEVVRPEAVLAFSVWDGDSIRRAVGAALALAATGRHRLSDPAAALTYDPGVAGHVRELLASLTAPGGSNSSPVPAGYP